MEMWHELVLCGIGGRTIEEAQRTISYQEFLRWCLYRNKRGSLNIGRRVEQTIGAFSAFYANSKTKHGGYSRLDFMPHEDEPPITLEKAMETWH